MHGNEFWPGRGERSKQELAFFCASAAQLLHIKLVDYSRTLAWQARCATRPEC